MSPPEGSSAPAEGLAADGSVIVVGASLAGLRAAETLRGEGFEGKISLVGEEPHLPYDRPPLSKQVLAGTWPPEKAVLADRHRASELHLHEVLGRRAVRLDVERRGIEFEAGEVFTADAIVLACGAAPRSLPGTEGLSQRDGRVHAAHARRLAGLAGRGHRPDGARVVVIGAGFIGAEVASTCAALGCRVTVLEVLDIPLRNVLGPVAGRHCASLHAAHGVDLRTGVSVLGVRMGGEGAGASPLVVGSRGGERCRPTWSSWASA